MKFIGIKKLYYGDVLTEKPTKSNLMTIIAGMTEVKNSHQDTFTYEQDDPETTDYINELTGKSYHIDKTAAGDKRINFTMGEYDFDNRVDLEGGTIDEEGVYAAPQSLEIIEKSIVALTKTGGYIVWPKANIVAKTDTQEKALGLGLIATAMTPDVDGMSDEYLIDGSLVPASTSVKTTSAKDSSKS